MPAAKNRATKASIEDVVPDYQPPAYNVQQSYHSNGYRERLSGVSNHKMAPVPHVAVVNAVVESKPSTPGGGGGRFQNEVVGDEDNESRGSRGSKASVPTAYSDDMDQTSEYDNQEFIDPLSGDDYHQNAPAAHHQTRNYHQHHQHPQQQQQQQQRRRRRNSSSESNESDSSEPGEEQALFKKVRNKSSPLANSLPPSSTTNHHKPARPPAPPHNTSKTTSYVEPWEDMNNHFSPSPTYNNRTYSDYATENELLNNKSSRKMYPDTSSLDRESII